MCPCASDSVKIGSDKKNLNVSSSSSSREGSIGCVLVEGLGLPLLKLPPLHWIMCVFEKNRYHYINFCVFCEKIELIILLHH